MPNSKHKPPALRLIVTEEGKQYPAFSDGTTFPRIISTEVNQNKEEAAWGVATVKIEMYVSPAPEGQMEQFAKFQNGILHFGENQIELKTWELKAYDPDINNLYELSFTTTVYPDPTTI